MVGYRRFVTYLFQYEHNQKMGNCGFAKVEVRQDRCRVELQAKSGFSGDFAVYLFARENGDLRGAYLGDITVQSGSGTAVFLFSAEKIGETPYGIDDMRGLYIDEEENGFIASQWDDAETDWSRFEAYLNNDGGQTDPDGITDGGTGNQAAGETLSGKGAEDTSGTEDTPELKSESERENTLRREDTPEPEGAPERENTLKQEDTLRRENTPEAGSASEPEDAPELQSTQVAAAAASPLPLQYEAAWEYQWERFAASHPVICPFDEDDRVWAVRLDLREFKVLPKRYWYLANNSFLLHGYFNYRYLLIGYAGEEEKRWFLGIPGVFQNQEQLLAGIFGFPDFRTKQKCVQKTGEFGYWYRFLEEM